MTILDAEQHATLGGGRSFTLRHLVYRVFWNLSWMLLASWTPPQLRTWRRYLLQMFGARIARTANVYGSAKIWYPANLEMGDYACLGPRSIAYSMAKITLEPYALVSQGAHLCAGTHDVEDVHFQLRARPIHIGRRAWIAAEAFVGPGVTIGEGAVLGARACAMRDIADWAICTGNPATKIRERGVRFKES
jgi:putative colanic acid biosynthesis acetyltransferase WcaF